MSYGTGPEFSDPDPYQASLVISLLILILQPSKSAPKPAVTTEPETSIPDWIKNNAEWWSSGQIPDSAFVSGIQWLISNNIIVIPSTEQDAGTRSKCHTRLDKKQCWMVVKRADS